MLTNRWNPFEELATLHRDMDRVFGRQFGEAGARATSGAWTPPSEVASIEDGWRVRLALPGVDPGQVQITLHGNTLRISGDRPAGEGQADVAHSEFVYGPFERTFTLPANVDGEKVTAHYEHGVLSLTVPMAESAKPRRIEIGGAGLRDIETRKLA